MKLSEKDKVASDFKSSNLQLALQVRSAKEEADKAWVSIICFIIYYRL